MKKPYVSKNVIQRMPRYLRTLRELEQEGLDRISSGELGLRMGLTPSQIRQDFSCFGGFGQQGYGYNVATLEDEVGRILGVDRGYSVILVGCGRIGQSLIENFDFSRFGFRLLGAFDIRKEIIGSQVGGFTVMDRAEMGSFIREHRIDVAILSTNREHVQQTTDQLIADGIRAIWNFTDQEIDAGSSGVKIESIHFSDSLLTLGYHLSSGED